MLREDGEVESEELAEGAEAAEADEGVKGHGDDANDEEGWSGGRGVQRRRGEWYREIGRRVRGGT
jgi:hypothetical protein